jgi:hypothetical protein
LRSADNRIASPRLRPNSSISTPPAYKRARARTEAEVRLAAAEQKFASLYELVVATVLSSPKIFAEDASLPVLDRGGGRTKTGYLWCCAVDDRPWCGPTHPAAAYIYAEDRKNARLAEHLARFEGVLQVNGYGGFKRLAVDRADMSIRLAFCWPHMRRDFLQFHVSTKSPFAAGVLTRIATLDTNRSEIRGQPAEYRRQVRQQRSRPTVEALHD